ncbi:hypothetical protein FJTKL_01421 [Diaporthe vaccinii]|uniref:Uncharacterized protein n=1 Tax=Diaporthe vaccinii TaxID=105482 RepID=A0ABR4E0T2_9PEZI
MVRSVHWASLTCAHAKRNVVTSHPNSRIRGSETICLSAARSFIKTLNDATTRPDNSRYNLLCPQTDYLLGTISVLYRNIFKYPHRMSAKADVEHLRAGTIHFERHASSADIITTLDKLFQAMLTSAEKVTAKEPTPDVCTITVAEPT